MTTTTPTTPRAAYEPRHRRDIADLPALIELRDLHRDHEVSVRTCGPDQHVYTAHQRTTDHDGQVLMVLSPAAASVLAHVLSRAGSSMSGSVGMAAFDPRLWQDVAFDLMRHERRAAEPVRGAR